MPDTASLLERFLPLPLAWSLQQPDPPGKVIAEGCQSLEAMVAAFAPFVPTPTLDIRLARPTLGRIQGMYLNGTVLFADIVGFTALASRLAMVGRRGNEELGAIATRLFAACLTEIETRGGGVIKFNGEQLTAFFDAGRLGQRHAELAAAAALAMREQQVDIAAGQLQSNSAQLRLRIALQSGRVFVADVGDQQHTECVFTGHAINRVVAAHEAALPGEVIIAEETLQLVGPAEAERRRGDFFVLHGLETEKLPLLAGQGASARPEPSLETLQTLLRQVAVLQAYLPHGLPRRYLHGQIGEGEFRPVTVLFTSFYPITKLLALLELPSLLEQDPSIVARVLDIYYTRIHAIVHRYGGTMHKVDMAPLGDRVMALFGAPTAHEDDPARATQAALEMRTALDETNAAIAELLREWTDAHPEQRALLQVADFALRQRIGIASGTVFAGIVGTPQRHEYTVMGRTVPLAARLLKISDGDVLLAAATYRIVRHLLEAQPMPPLRIEGFARAVPFFRAEHWRGRSKRTAATPLIGRQAELERLLACARMALQDAGGAGHVISIVGDPGIGKSRLTEEAVAAAQADLPAVLVRWETCQSYEQSTPYAAATRLIRRLLRLPAGDTPAERASLFQQQLAELVPGWSRFAPLLAPLLDLSLPDTALIRALTPEQRRERLHDLMVMLCLALARRQPLILVVDDIQWADTSSQTILARLAEELSGNPLLLWLIHRPTAELATPWSELAHSTVIALGELSSEDSEALLAALLEGTLPAELRPLRERTRGIPFFLEEMVRYLRESGALRRAATGEWVWTRAIDESALPIQVTQLIVARLDRLHEDARALLNIAAVIGQQFSVDLLALINQQHGGLERWLVDLVDATLLVPVDAAPEPTYRFKHALIRDVAYSNILYAQRRELHEQVAATIEHLYAADLDAHRVVLAQHYLLAGNLQRAFPHLLAAAQRAQARSAYREARDLYELAIASAPWHDRREMIPDMAIATALHENLGDVLALLGDPTAARTQYQYLLTLLDRLPPHERAVPQAALLRKIGAAFEHQGNLDAALVAFVRASDCIRPELGAPATALEYARLLSDMGWLHFRRGALEEAWHDLEQALAYLADEPSAAERARVLNRLGGVAYARGDLMLAQQYVARSLEASQQQGDLMHQASMLNNLCILSQSQGAIDDAIRYGLEAMELHERVGNRRELAITAINLGFACYYAGQFEQAHEYWSRALHNAVDVRDTYHQMLALLNLGRLRAELRRWADAQQAVHQSLFIAVQLRLPAVQIEGQVVLGEIALRQGDLEQATQALAEGQSLVTETESEEYGRLQRLEAQLAHGHGDAPQARLLLQANEQLFIRLHNLSEAARTRKLLATLEGD
jgi:predicted ATPase/class 3 adenylate cyclase